ncbi:MAG: hypothetical protein NTZ74_07055 [Chloroflexi bacterium]|nr:hypothetical protein [Chloroflexota bacterium]
MVLLFAFPIILILSILQIGIVRNIVLLHGTADLVLIWLSAWGIQGRVKNAWIWALIAGITLSYISALPWYVPFISYGGTMFFARQVNKKIWQSPLMMMFLVTILGSILLYTLSYGGLLFMGSNISWKDSLLNVIVPSILLNLLFAIPVFAVAKDFSHWVYPVEANE